MPNSPFEYVPFLPNLLIIYADRLVPSMDERDAEAGRIPETEVGFWLMTAAMQKTAAGTLPDYLAWFIPYLLVDDGSAMATDREIYRFNKQPAAFGKASNIQAPQFSVEVLGFQHFAPAAVAQKEHLPEVHSLIQPTSQSKWSDWETARSDVSDMILQPARTDLGYGIVPLAAQTTLQNSPLVFLKQIRQAADPQKACYSSIVEGPLQMKTFHGGGLFSQPNETNLRPIESHPLAEKLGSASQQISNVGTWLTVDLILGLGTEYHF